MLRVWQARLVYGTPDHGAAWRIRLVSAIAIALFFGALVRLPALWLGEDWCYPRFAPSCVLLALSSYFWIEHRDRVRLIAGLGMALAAVVYVRPTSSTGNCHNS